MSKEIFSSIGMPSGKNILEKADAMNGDIIYTINKNVPEGIIHVSNIADKFKAPSRIQVAAKIWKFLKENISYKRDSTEAQLVKLPKRFLKDSTGDCKSYALFTASILGALKIPFKIRYASYNGLKIPTHVYVVTESENGKEIIIDAVWNEFNSEKQPKYKKDMRVYTLSGVQSNVRYTPLNGLFKSKKERQEKKEERKEKRQEKKEERKEKRQEKKEDRKEKRSERKEKRRNFLKKVGIAPARAAFLGLVKLNVRGFASKLAASIKKDPKQWEKVWKGLGGDFKQFASTVAEGAGKQRILGIGLVAAGTAAATIAAAAPVIAIIVKYLKRDKNADQEIIDAEGMASDSLRSSGNNPGDVVSNLDEEINDTGTSFKPSPVLLIGAAGLALLLLKK